MLLLAVFPLMLVAPTAAAHAQLVSTTPSNGQVLTSSPTVVAFTFDELLLPGSTTISVNDAAGTLVTGGPVTPDGASVSLPITTALVAGNYQAAYRVVSGDGHAVTGAITFTVSGSTISGSTGAPAPASGSKPPPPPAPGGSGLVLVVAAAVIVGALAAVLVMRRAGRAR